MPTTQHPKIVAARSKINQRREILIDNYALSTFNGYILSYRIFDCAIFFCFDQTLTKTLTHEQSSENETQISDESMVKSDEISYSFSCCPETFDHLSLDSPSHQFTCDLRG